VSNDRSATVADDDRVDHISRTYQELRKLIISGQLAPGARISERAVGERLGVSRTPVRSALHRLQQEGLVSRPAGRGRLIVAPLSQHDAREVFLIVGHLEGLAARLVAGLPTPQRRALVRRLRQVNHELAAASRGRGDSAREFDLDREFHTTYVEEAASPRLLTLYQTTRSQSERYLRLYVSALVTDIATSVREHGVIVNAISKGNPDAAQRAAEINWANAADRLAKVIAQYGERGTWNPWA
jgi:DNA-binding GntR family transcriptional regulator